MTNPNFQLNHERIAGSGLSTAHMLINNMKRHSAPPIRVNTVQTFLYPVVKDEVRRSHFVAEDRIMLQEIVPLLIDSMASPLKFKDEDLQLFYDDTMELIEMIIAGRRAPYHKVGEEAEVRALMAQHAFLPYRTQLVVGVHEVATRGLTLVAHLRLLKRGTHKGQDVYRDVHTDRITIKAAMPT